MASSGREEDEEFIENLGDEIEAEDYSGESDVFEDDVEAIVYSESRNAQENGGLGDCSMEMRAGVVEYTYPAYLSKLPALLTDDSVFGKNPRQYIYCNNLMVRFGSSLEEEAARALREMCAAPPGPFDGAGCHGRARRTKGTGANEEAAPGAMERAQTVRHVIWIRR